MSAKTKKKAQAHQRYYNLAGKRVPGTTTVTGVMDKPALVGWANGLGLDGIEVSEYVSELADAGTLAHKMIEDYIASRETETDSYSKDQIDMAENAVLKFYGWEKNKEIKYLSSELQLISEKYQYGGTCDIYAEVDGVKTLIDLKTGKAVYSEAYTQVAAYRQLLTEHEFDVEDVRILRIGRDESEGFDDIHVPKIDTHFERFLACLRLYELNKELKRKGGKS